MRISASEQSDRDFDWYCVDEEDRIGHFTTAGFKLLPRSVADCGEDLNFLDNFFRALDGATDGHELDPRLTSEQRIERYLRDFIAMADRGLYSFDIETYGAPDISYFRVAIPKQPLNLPELPDKVREVLERTRLNGHALRTTADIPYVLTLGI
jgi:hypothetical protein